MTGHFSSGGKETYVGRLSGELEPSPAVGARMLSIFLGYDPREARAYEVARSSALRRASAPINIEPLVRQDLQTNGILDRPVENRDGKLWCPISEAPMSTEFAISRFAIPFVAKGGWALFCDCDVVFLDDVANLFRLADERYAVMVVKHDYRPAETMKMDGQAQTVYQRKNWSSVMLWNLDHSGNKRLDKQALNGWAGRDLHAFKWLKDDEIGELPLRWNYLVGVSRSDYRPSDVSLAHYTLGGPWFSNWRTHTEWDQAWLDEEKSMRGREARAI